MIARPSGTGPAGGRKGAGEIKAKLQIKDGQTVAVVGLPEGLGLDLGPEALPGEADAVIVFVRGCGDLETTAAPAIEAARRDALAWIAYPKAGKLDTDLNRDSLRQRLEDRGIRPVRQVAIDDTWSALRFRPA